MVGNLCRYKYLNGYRSCIIYLGWFDDISKCMGCVDNEIFCK